MKAPASITIFMMLLATIGLGQSQQFVATKLASPTFNDFIKDQSQMTFAGIAIGSKSFDLGQTLWHKSHYVYCREDWLPSQSSGWIAVNLLGSEAGATAMQYYFFRRHHTRLAIATQIISAGLSAEGAAYSFTHVKVLPLQPRGLPEANAPLRSSNRRW